MLANNETGVTVDEVGDGIYRLSTPLDIIPGGFTLNATSTSAILERLAQLDPKMLACQHGSAYRGDGAALLRELSAVIEHGSAATVG